MAPKKGRKGPKKGIPPKKGVPLKGMMVSFGFWEGIRNNTPGALSHLTGNFFFICIEASSQPFPLQDNSIAYLIAINRRRDFGQVPHQTGASERRQFRISTTTLYVSTMS